MIKLINTNQSDKRGFGEENERTELTSGSSGYVRASRCAKVQHGSVAVGDPQFCNEALPGSASYHAGYE